MKPNNTTTNLDETEARLLSMDTGHVGVQVALRLIGALREERAKTSALPPGAAPAPALDILHAMVRCADERLAINATSPLVIIARDIIAASDAKPNGDIAAASLASTEQRRLLDTLDDVQAVAP